MDVQQFGNMKSSSTSYCLISFLDLMHSHLEKRDASIALGFIDFGNVFDLVDHTVLSKVITAGFHPYLIVGVTDLPPRLSASSSLTRFYLHPLTTHVQNLPRHKTVPLSASWCSETTLSLAFRAAERMSNAPW